jgi:hypothetical protein
MLLSVELRSISSNDFNFVPTLVMGDINYSMSLQFIGSWVFFVAAF